MSRTLYGLTSSLATAAGGVTWFVEPSLAHLWFMLAIIAALWQINEGVGGKEGA